MTDKLREALETAANRLDWCSSKFPAGSVEAEFVNDWVKEANDTLSAAPQPAAEDREAHPDDAAVDRFAAAMKAKLAASRAKGRNGWDGDLCTDQFLAEMLVGHLSKGNAGNFEDIANLAMMLHQRGADPAVLRGAAAPTDNTALVEVLRPYVGDRMAEAIADALPASGLRLPGDETMAWAVVEEDGKIDPRRLWINSRDAEEYCERGERAVRVAIRVVDGGDNAA